MERREFPCWSHHPSCPAPPLYVNRSPFVKCLYSASAEQEIRFYWYIHSSLQVHQLQRNRTEKHSQNEDWIQNQQTHWHTGCLLSTVAPSIIIFHCSDAFPAFTGKNISVIMSEQMSAVWSFYGFFSSAKSFILWKLIIDKCNEIDLA